MKKLVLKNNYNHQFTRELYYQILQDITLEIQLQTCVFNFNFTNITFLKLHLQKLMEVIL